MILGPGEKFKMIVEDPTTKYTLQHLKTGIHVYVSPERFDEVFEAEKPAWTKWKYYRGINSSYFIENIYVRNNGRKVQVRMRYKGKNITAEASCSPQDRFDEKVGAKLAFFRLMGKIYKAIEDEFIRGM